MIILGGLVFLWYQYLGILIISTNQEGYKIEVADKKYENVKKKKIIFLRPGYYVLKVNKEDYREFEELIQVKPFKKNKKEITLSKIFYVSTLQNTGDFDVSFLEKYDDNNLIYFSSANNAFYTVPLDSKSYIIGDYKAQKIEADLRLQEGEQVFDIEYSLSRKQAFIFVGFVDAMVIKWHDFETNQTRELDSSVFGANWLSDDEAVAIKDEESSKLVKLAPNGSRIQELTDIPNGPLAIYKSPKFVLIESGTYGEYSSWILINLENLKKTPVELSETGISEMKGSPQEDKFIGSTFKDGKAKVFLVNSDGSKEELPISPYLGNVIWTSDGQGLIYVSFDESQKTYNFEKYNFADKKSAILASFSQAEGDPSNLIINNNYVNFILGQSIMGFKIE